MRNVWLGRFPLLVPRKVPLLPPSLPPTTAVKIDLCKFEADAADGRRINLNFR